MQNSNKKCKKNASEVNNGKFQERKNTFCWGGGGARNFGPLSLHQPRPFPWDPETFFDKMLLLK
jgi:hypothetical protein